MFYGGSECVEYSQSLFRLRQFALKKLIERMYAIVASYVHLYYN